MSIDGPVLGCCADCGKGCFKNAHNWRKLSQEWASQLKIDFEKANAAADAGCTGVARLCCACRAKSKKPKHSGRNGRKGKGQGKGIKRKMDDNAFEEPPIDDLAMVEVQCAVCSSSVRSDGLRIIYPCYRRAASCSGSCDMACKSCTAAAQKKYRHHRTCTWRCAASKSASPMKTRQMKPSDFLAQIRELQMQMWILRENVEREAGIGAKYHKAF